MTNEIIVLGQWEKAKRAIAECKNIDEVKKIRDKAEALRAYAKQAKESLEVQNNVAEIKLHCERKIGEFSKDLPTKQGTSSHDGKKSILQEAGIKHYERYEAIANLPEEEFEKHIAEVKASNEELTTIGVIKLARKLEPKPKNVPFPEGKYNIIYADPAWQFDNAGFSQSAANHYPTMSTEEIMLLPVKAEKDSIIFLWATNAMLEDALKVMKAWGFEYKSNIVWIKNRGVGIGWFVDSRHEILLIGVKGDGLHPKFKPTSWVEAISTKHSKKPEIFYEIIEKMYPNQKYIELFARNNRKQWISWGNQITE